MSIARVTQNLAFGDPQESTQPCIKSEAASNKSRLAFVQFCPNAMIFPIILEVGQGGCGGGGPGGELHFKSS